MSQADIRSMWLLSIGLIVAQATGKIHPPSESLVS